MFHQQPAIMTSSQSLSLKLFASNHTTEIYLYVCLYSKALSVLLDARSEWLSFAQTNWKLNLQTGLYYIHTQFYIWQKLEWETDYACASLFAHKIYYLAPRLLVKRVRCVYYVSASKKYSGLISDSKLRQTTNNFSCFDFIQYFRWDKLPQNHQFDGKFNCQWRNSRAQSSIIGVIL